MTEWKETEKTCPDCGAVSTLSELLKDTGWYVKCPECGADPLSGEGWVDAD